METTFNRSNLDRVVAVINGKGGVGKTSICANLGGLLATQDWKVLIVDLDNQGNLGDDLGYSNGPLDDNGEALATALLNAGTSRETPLVPVNSTRKNLDVLVGGNEIDDVILMLQAKQASGRHVKDDPDTDIKYALARLLQPLADIYDIIFIDCPPNNKILQTMTIVAAQYALLPTRSDGASLNGLAQISEILESHRIYNQTITTLGIVLFDTGAKSTNIHKQVSDAIIEMLSIPGDPVSEKIARDLLFDPFVRHMESSAVATREAGKLAHEMEGVTTGAGSWFKGNKKTSATVAGDYKLIARELTARITKFEQKAQIPA